MTIALEVAGLRKTFAKDGKAFDILDIERFTAREGEFITIIGPSGCGKSTFLHMMGGFIGADAGTIRVYGNEVREPGPDRGMMFQEFALFPWKTVAGNVAWGLETQGYARKDIDETVQRYLDITSLADFRNHYPAELSGGMKQRVALARVLAFDPEGAADGRALRRAGRADARDHAGRGDAPLGAHAARPSSSSPTTSRRRCTSATA